MSLALLVTLLSDPQPVPAAATTAIVAEAAARPMLDGRCDDPAYQDATAHALGDGVGLFAVSDALSFTLCIALPQPGFAALDLVLEPEVGGPVELHVSARLGERPWTPTVARPWTFEPVSGWFSPVTPYVAMEGAAPRFRDVSAREIQFDRTQFDASSYGSRVSISALSPSAGERLSAGHAGDLVLLIA